MKASYLTDTRKLLEKRSKKAKKGDDSSTEDED
jgi:hypothetical protein